MMKRTPVFRESGEKIAMRPLYPSFFPGFSELSPAVNLFFTA